MEELQDQLHKLRLNRDRELRERWDRSLPFADGLFDRWERARRFGWEEGVSIYDSAFVLGDVHVGENTWIGPNVMLDGSGGTLTIGAWCSISTGVQIYTHDTVLWALSAGECSRDTAPVTVGDRCFIGPAAIISAGVTVGPMSVVGAGSFVNRDVPERTVVAGSPARVVGRVAGDGDTVRTVRQISPKDHD